MAVLVALAVMVYIAWRGSKGSDFFAEAVSERYLLELPEAETDLYYELKDRFQQQVGFNADAPAEGPDGAPVRWAHKLAPEERHLLQQALMKRLVKTIQQLDRVQTDKPGNWKLWRGKLVSEHFWASLCDAERVVGEEIDCCLAESDELEPGWREHIFHQAVQIWRMERQQLVEKKDAKKAVVQEKKNKKQEVTRAVVEEKQAAEALLKQERLAEKAMEKLLREEESNSKKDKSKGKEKAAAKPKAKKK